jgi:hypothetical protein
MSSEYQLRPRYRFQTSEKESSIIERLSKGIEDSGPLRLRKTNNHLIIAFSGKQKHFWSPEMDLNVESRTGKDALIRVLIGPAAAIWTFFMFLYSVAALLLVGGLILGYSQFALNKPMWGFYLIPASVVAAVGIYLAGLWGKSRAHHQMEELKSYFDRALAGFDIRELG